MCNCCSHHCCCIIPERRPEAEPPTTPDTKPTTPAVREDCTCSVIFRSIRVHDTGEASKGEWSLEMNVNGVTKRWNHDVAEDSYNLNVEFRLSSCDTPINIKVGGWEKDPGGKSGGLFDFIEDNDDELSDFLANYSAPNVDPSVVRSYDRRTSNRTGDYTIYYEILRTCKQIKTVSKSTILNSMKSYIAAVKKSGAEFKLKSEDELIGSALTRLRRAGWNVVGISGETFVLEGFMPLGKRERLKMISKKRQRRPRESRGHD